MERRRERMVWERMRRVVSGVCWRLGVCIISWGGLVFFLLEGVFFESLGGGGFSGAGLDLGGERSGSGWGWERGTLEGGRERERDDGRMIRCSSSVFSWCSVPVSRKGFW